MRITYDGFPATLINGVISFAGTPLAGSEEIINNEVQTYIDAHQEYWPDFNAVALIILRETGSVEVIDAGASPPFDESVTY
jgi:hypothetical protein